MLITLLILFISAIFFVRGTIRSDMVALCALLALMLCNILTPSEALSGFSNSIVIMMIGVFIVGGAIFQTGLAKILSRKILAMAGDSETKLFFLIMLATSAIGAFVSNTGTVAVMLPIVVSLATSAKISPSRFLMPLAFASSMGGMLTLIGTAPNLVINNVLMDAGHESLTLFSFLPVGLVCVTLGTLTLAPLSKWLLSQKKDDRKEKHGEGQSLFELAEKYRLSQNIYRARVTPASSVMGHHLRSLEAPQRYNVSIVEIRRKTADKKPFARDIEQIIPGPDSILYTHDILYVMGSFADVHNFAEENRLALIDATEMENAAATMEDEHRFDAIGIAEVVLLSTSKLVNQKVQDSGFRENYSISILGIQRKNDYILQGLKDEKMLAGDALLVQGEWGSIARLGEEQSEWVVVGQPLTEASKLTLSHKAPWAALILLLMIVAMATSIVPTVTAVMIAAMLMIFTGCFRNVEEAYKTINWESVVLIAAMLPTSLAIEKTGAATMASHFLVNGLGGYGPFLLLAAIYFATSLLTLFISNTATAVLFAPIALQSATGLGISPYPFLFAVTVAASMCFASPFSTPPNALVMSAGRYTFVDYVKVGAPLQLLFGIVMVLVLPLIFPF